MTNLLNETTFEEHIAKCLANSTQFDIGYIVTCYIKDFTSTSRSSATS